MRNRIKLYRKWSNFWLNFLDDYIVIRVYANIASDSHGFAYDVFSWNIRNINKSKGGGYNKNLKFGQLK